MATLDENIYDHVGPKIRLLCGTIGVMHKATNFEIMRYERTIRRTTTTGDVLPERLNNNYFFLISSINLC